MKHIKKMTVLSLISSAIVTAVMIAQCNYVAAAAWVMFGLSEFAYYMQYKNYKTLQSHYYDLYKISCDLQTKIYNANIRIKELEKEV